MSAPKTTLLTWLPGGQKKKKESAGVSTAPAQTRAKTKESQAPKKAEKLNFLGRLKEANSADLGNLPGTRFEAILLQEGMGNLDDCYYYTKEAIQSCPPLFEGKKLFIDHPDLMEEKTRPERSVRDVAGWFEGCRVVEADDGRLMLMGEAVLSQSPDIFPYRVRMTESIAYTKTHPNQDFVAFSINAGGDFDTIPIEHFLQSEKIPESCMPKIQEAMNRGVSMVRPVRRMTSATSCDLVTEAGAGGKIAQLLERERGNMKIKEAEKKETDKKEADAKEAKAKEDGAGGDAAHPDKKQDEDLIKGMMKKYLGDGFSDEDHGMAKEAYEHAMKHCGGDQDEAMKMAGYSLKMARSMKAAAGPEATMQQAEKPAEEAAKESAEPGFGGGAKKDGEGFNSPKAGPAAASVPHQDQVTESASGKSAKRETELLAENARLKLELESERLEKFIDKTLRESRLPMSATKKFRESIKSVKTEKEVGERFGWFKEAYLAGEGDADGFIVSPEKSSGKSDGGMSFADCKQDE